MKDSRKSFIIRENRGFTVAKYYPFFIIRLTTLAMLGILSWACSSLTAPRDCLAESPSPSCPPRRGVRLYCTACPRHFPLGA